jgi:hypothetical protein
VVEIADDNQRSAARSTLEAREVEVAGVAISFDRAGQAEDDAVAAFIVILPVGGTSENCPSGTEIVEAALFCRGLNPIATLAPDSFSEMPTLDRWSVISDQSWGRLTILEPTGCLYDGLLGRSVPEGWYACLARQRALVLLIAAGNDSPITSASLADLCEAGRLMGGRVAVHPSPLPSARCRST